MTGVVVNVKVAVLPPALTVTLAGTVTEGSLLDNVTKAPPVGAGLFRVTVPVREVPPGTLAGPNARVAIPEGGVTVKVPVRGAPL